MELRFTIEFESHLFLLEHLPGMHCIEIPEHIVQKLGGKFSIRLICTVNGALSFSCGLVALGGGSGYISLNKKRMKELGVKNGDTLRITLQPDDSEYGMEVSEELGEILRQDEEASRRFKALTPGKQRYIIHYVSMVKSSSLRIERGLLLLTNLKKLPEGKETFRGMLGMEPR
ncbi:MAG: YdeI/OmpD-associated family protein [Flavobacteriales bacterium]|nr:YdeI/OmpD-associated family protein [Flavobacteriales bacterium]